MRFERDGIQREIADAAREFLSTAWSFERLRAVQEGGFPGDVWQQLDELGWFELLVPEENGGLGLGAIEAAAVFEEAGRSLLPGPLFDNVVVAAICGAGTDWGRVAFAINDPGSETAFTAGRLNGMKTLVESADVVDTVLAVVVHGSARAIVAVPSDAVSVRPMGSGDAANRPFEVFVDGAPADILAAGRDAEDVLDRVFTWGHVMTTARALGVIDRILELSVDYAKQREQFGKPIGSFQAVQHRLADMAVLAVSSRSVSSVAQWALATDAPDTAHQAHVAKAYVSRAVRRVAESGIQVHGGVGFTDEHDLHLLVKHALTLEGAWGDAGRHEDALADRLLQGIGIEVTEPAGRA